MLWNGFRKRNKLGAAELRISKAIAPHFNRPYYLQQNPDVGRGGVDPLVHFMLWGWREGRDPTPEFSTLGYLAQNPDVAAAGVNPFWHFHTVGKSERRVWKTLGTGVSPRSVSAGPPLSEHQISNEVAAIQDAFDTDFYLRNNPDVAQARIDPVRHFVVSGWKEGRDPTPEFSVPYYLEANPDVREQWINPFWHYIVAGKSEGREFRRPMGYLSDRLVLGYDFDSETATIFLEGQELAPLERGRLIVHIHCYYLNVLDSLLDHIAVLQPCAPILWVTTPFVEDVDAIHEKAKARGFAAIETIICTNKGRDIGSLIVEILPRLAAEDIVLHVHTKNSPERGEDFGAKWMSDMLNHTVRDAAFVGGVLSAFQSSRSVGLLAPRPIPEIRPFMRIGGNGPIISELSGSLRDSAPLSERDYAEFPAGSFFWFRPSALQWLRDAGLNYRDFPDEPIPDDGTLAHAIERMLIQRTRAAGLIASYIAPRAPHVGVRPAVGARKVSVVIPCRNAMPWLAACLQSCLQQDTPGFEIEVIVVDDGSTDGSRDYAKMIAATDSRLRCVATPGEGSGTGLARNLGMSLATGTYITFLDADDALIPTALGQMMDVIRSADPEETPEVVVSSLRMVSEDRMGDAIPHGNHGMVEVVKLGTSGAAIDTWKRLLFDFGACAKLYDRRFLVDHGIEFPAERFEDNYFIYAALLHSRSIAVLSSATYLYRKYQSRHTSTASTALKSQDEKILLDQLTIVERTLAVVEEKADFLLRRIALGALFDKLRSEAERVGTDEVFRTRLQDSKPLRQAAETIGLGGDLDALLAEVNQ